MKSWDVSRAKVWDIDHKSECKSCMSKSLYEL